MPKIDQPTTSEVLLWESQLSGERGSLDAEQEEEESLYFQKFGIDAPGGRLAVKTGSAPADVDAAVDSLVPTDVVINVRPSKQTDQRREQAEKLSRLGRALLVAWRKQKDPLRKIANDMAIRRLGIARVMYDADLWPDVPEGLAGDALDRWEARNRTKCPVLLQRRNPRYVGLREDDDGAILAVAEKYPTTVLEARLQFGNYPRTKVILSKRDPNERVWVKDVWVGDWRALFIEDQPLFPGGSGSYKGVLPHGYPEIPYIPVPFRELPFDEPERKYRGMLSNAAGLYPIESQVLSMQVSMLAWNAWRTYQGWTIDGRPLEVIPGKYIPIDRRKGEWLEMLEGNPVPPELLQTAAVMDGYIQRNGVSQGPSTAEGTRSGQQLWAIQSMRMLKIEAAKQSLQHLVTRSLTLAAQQIELLVPDELTLPIGAKDAAGKDMGSITVRPQDIDGYWSGWDVSFSRRLDPATIEQAKALMAFAMNNFIPLKEALRLSGLVDVPQEWIDALMEQAIERMPFMLEVAGNELLTSEFGEQSWEVQTYRQRIAQSQQPTTPPGGGGPGVPSGGGGGMTPPSMNGPVGVNPLVGAAMQGGGPRKVSRMSGNVQGPRVPGGGRPGGGQ